jgi:hypothetical protein
MVLGPKSLGNVMFKQAKKAAGVSRTIISLQKILANNLS